MAMPRDATFWTCVTSHDATAAFASIWEAGSDTGAVVVVVAFVVMVVALGAVVVDPFAVVAVVVVVDAVVPTGGSSANTPRKRNSPVCPTILAASSRFYTPGRSTEIDLP